MNGWLTSVIVAVLLSFAVRMWVPEEQISSIAKLFMAIGGVVFFSILMMLVGFAFGFLRVNLQTYKREDGENMISLQMGTKDQMGPK